MDETALTYQIALTLLPKVGNINARKLIAYCGSVEAVFKEKKHNLMKIPGIGREIAGGIVSQNVLKKAEKEVDFVKKQQLKPLFYLDKAFPFRLAQCADAPLLLFVKGENVLNAPKILSIVGTRKATNYGKSLIENLLKDLHKRGHNPLIVSGLAYGIDIAAHREALKNGLPTAAVLAHGLDSVYPPLHAQVARNIVDSGGALISEFRSQTKPEPSFFVQRNRIVAGMADATIVVESGKKGGALITAEIANSYSREVFAFPGRKGDEYSAGCNWLIKTNRAILIENARDVERGLNWDIKKQPPRQATLFATLSGEEQKLVDSLEKETQNIDILSMNTSIPMSKLSAMLLDLEFRGIVKSLPGKMFTLAK